MTFDTPSTSTIDQRPGFVAMAFRPWQKLIDAMARRKTYAALSELNDHMLKDIGVSRSEIAWRSRSANLPCRPGRFAPPASKGTSE
ncbi:MAG TPA: DUF1127 domain-containing protein [Nitrosospira sp.]|jgi:uncharacterized protein YjiS (DUF1127 family)|nr:DUF1127 domain-containing protein [Nitrosospira sp.]